MDWYLKVLKNYIGFGGPCAAQRVLDVYSGQPHPDRRIEHHR